MVLGGYGSPFAFLVSKAYLERWRVKTAGSLDVSKLSGTGYLLFLACLQVSKLARAHLVLLLVLAGVIPLDRTASWSSSTNDEKRSWLGGKPVVVSAALELAVAARASVPVSEGGAELGGLFGRGVGAVISPARAAPGQSYHAPLTESKTGRVVRTSCCLSRSFFFA